jgi:DNA-binding transcriptional ArsR family regulator
MAFSKSHRFTKEDQALCAFAKAISHPARVMILRQLAKRGPCKVMSILKNHPISQPAMSQHLRILRKAHLVKYQEQFPHTFYSLDVETSRIAAGLLKSFLKELK